MNAGLHVDTFTGLSQLSLLHSHPGPHASMTLDACSHGVLVGFPSPRQHGATLSSPKPRFCRPAPQSLGRLRGLWRSCFCRPAFRPLGHRRGRGRRLRRCCRPAPRLLGNRCCRPASYPLGRRRARWRLNRLFCLPAPRSLGCRRGLRLRRFCPPRPSTLRPSQLPV